MKTLSVTLPDAVHSLAVSEANQQRTNVEMLCSALLADHFLTGKSCATPSNILQQAKNETDNADGFDVARHFRGFPHRSIRFAQEFVDEVLKFPHVIAMQNNSGIAFKPNFAYIEALLRQGSRSGIRVSFFGLPNQFKNSPAVLKTGRPPSYSRAVIEDESDLKAILPIIRQAYELRFGRLS